MKKVLKFSKFSAKRKLIQYSLVSILLIFLSFHVFYTGKKMLNKRRVQLIEEYSYKVSTLKKDKEENLKKIELEYDEKIEKFQAKIEELQEKLEE